MPTLRQMEGHRLGDPCLDLPTNSPRPQSRQKVPVRTVTFQGSEKPFTACSSKKWSVRKVDLEGSESSPAAVSVQKATSQDEKATTENQVLAGIISDLRERLADSEAKLCKASLEADSLREQLAQAQAELRAHAANAWYEDDVGEEAVGFQQWEPSRGPAGAAQRAPPPAPVKVRNLLAQEGEAQEGEVAPEARETTIKQAFQSQVTQEGATARVDFQAFQSQVTQEGATTSVDFCEVAFQDFLEVKQQKKSSSQSGRPTL